MFSGRLWPISYSSSLRLRWSRRPLRRGRERSAEGGSGLIGKIAAEGQYTLTDTSGRRRGVERPLVAVVKEAIAGSGRPLVIDDFHFITRDAQRDIVRALKPLALQGVPIIFVSISHRVQDVVSAEPDMTGRVVPLKVSLWSDSELRYIAQAGFRVLNLIDENGELASRLAAESYGSPHLMQKFCRELCKANGVREEQSAGFRLSPPMTGASSSRRKPILLQGTGSSACSPALRSVETSGHSGGLRATARWTATG